MPDMITGKNGAAMVLENVGFKISGKDILKPLTFRFPGQCVTGLIGQNGSGKSTLLKILARQNLATSGRVWFGGRPLESWGERDFARNVAYLPQYTPLAAGLNVRELVALGRYPWHGAFGRFGPGDFEKVDEALELTSTKSVAERLVDSLSGGERQRVWLAMLLAQDARLLLLDEPISALDVAHQVEVLGLVHRLSVEKSIGVIVVIHEINLAARYCDGILALKEGRMISHGPPNEFMTAARLEEIYDVAMGVFPHPDSGDATAYVRV
jgi:iron-chelate-transporting ATPase